MMESVNVFFLSRTGVSSLVFWVGSSWENSCWCPYLSQSQAEFLCRSLQHLLQSHIAPVLIVMCARPYLLFPKFCRNRILCLGLWGDRSLTCTYLWDWVSLSFQGSCCCSASIPHSPCLGVSVSTELVSGQFSWGFMWFLGLHLFVSGRAEGFEVWKQVSLVSSLSTEWLICRAFLRTCPLLDRQHGWAGVGPIPLPRLPAAWFRFALFAFVELEQRKGG